MRIFVLAISTLLFLLGCVSTSPIETEQQSEPKLAAEDVQPNVGVPEITEIQQNEPSAIGSARQQTSPLNQNDNKLRASEVETTPKTVIRSEEQRQANIRPVVDTHNRSESTPAAAKIRESFNPARRWQPNVGVSENTEIQQNEPSAIGSARQQTFPLNQNDNKLRASESKTTPKSFVLPEEKSQAVERPNAREESNYREPIKKSRTGICHAPGSTYYKRTKYFESFRSLDACLKSGGRLPKR